MYIYTYTYIYNIQREGGKDAESIRKCDKLITDVFETWRKMKNEWANAGKKSGNKQGWIEDRGEIGKKRQQKSVSVDSNVVLELWFYGLLLLLFFYYFLEWNGGAISITWSATITSVPQDGGQVSADSNGAIAMQSMPDVSERNRQWELWPTAPYMNSITPVSSSAGSRVLLFAMYLNQEFICLTWWMSRYETCQYITNTCGTFLCLPSIAGDCSRPHQFRTSLGMALQRSENQVNIHQSNQRGGGGVCGEGEGEEGRRQWGKQG